MDMATKEARGNIMARPPNSRSRSESRRGSGSRPRNKKRGKKSRKAESRTNNGPTSTWSGGLRDKKLVFFPWTPRLKNDLLCRFLYPPPLHFHPHRPASKVHDESFSGLVFWPGELYGMAFSLTSNEIFEDMPVLIGYVYCSDRLKSLTTMFNIALDISFYGFSLTEIFYHFWLVCL